MIEKVFAIDNFNVISDNENYYFFRALNKADNIDVESGITIDNDGKIARIRTDRERYEGIPKYSDDSELTLEEMFHHIKMNHRTDTNCISLTSNANAAVMYGRGYYKDRYVMVKVPKKDLGTKVINAGQYMLTEVQKIIEEYASNNELDAMTKYYLEAIDNARNQEMLDRIIETTRLDDIEDGDMFEKGITYSFSNTTSVDYQALNEEQNFWKNKIIAKLDILNHRVLKSASNKFLIQTIGNAFSSLEFIHYKDIQGENVIEVPYEFVDMFALIQQLPENNELALELNSKILSYITSNSDIYRQDFSFRNYELNSDEEYTIEKMYNLTNGNIDFYDAINVYRKSFYLAKSKLRAESVSNLVSKITEYDPKYEQIIKYLIDNTYGIEPQIFSRMTSNKLKISESVNLDFSPKERELFDFIDTLSTKELVDILNNPIETLQFLLQEFPRAKNRHIDQETYYANAVIDLFDWSKLDVIKFSIKQRSDLVNKLKESHCLEVYNILKERGVKEKDIANVLLTSIIRNKSLGDLNNIDTNETFTVEQLEDFLGYYRINNTKGLKLRSYQATTLRNINKRLKNKQYTSAVLPTGAGKSFVTLAKMLQYKDKEILYLAPNDEILNQMARYIVEYVHGETLTKTPQEIIKGEFPHLKLHTYASLLSLRQKEIIEHKYDFIITDEEQRTGSPEYEKHLLELFNYQDKTTQVLGITATPRRDVDCRDMTEVWAKYFGYTEEEIARHEHLAINMDLFEAIRCGYVMNPKIVNCEYTTQNENGLLDNLLEKINLITNEEQRNTLLVQFDTLRKKVHQADGVEKVLTDNIGPGCKCIVFCPVSNHDGKILEDECGYSEDYRVSAQQVIDKYRMELENYFGAENTEFYSMLGEYSKSKNKYQLQNFEKDDDDKIKFMLVINKLNEGTHIKKANRIIWYRPLDENSYILLFQQLGRIVWGIDPNYEYTDEDRPIAIDLANNTLRVNLEKNAKRETNDIDKLIIISDWIEQHDFRIPDINSSDRVEARYASNLKQIQFNYRKYLDNPELIDKLSPEDKIKISTVIDLVSNIDLWSVDFPAKIVKERSSSKDSLTSFELTGILRDFCDLEKRVIDSLVISLEERKEEYIQSINELKRHPKQRVHNNGESERLFTRDGVDQRGWYGALQAKYQKINKLGILTDDELLIKDVYEEIQLALEEAEIFVEEERKKEYIESIISLKRHPKRGVDNNGDFERVFTRDGFDQRSWFIKLKYLYNSIDMARTLTSEEKRIKKMYEEIEAVFKQYATDEDRKTEYIETIKRLKRHPKPPVDNDGISEVVFSNTGADQRNWYNDLQRKCKALVGLTKLTPEQQRNKDTLEEIDRVFEEVEILLEQEKKEEYIKSIEELNRHPRQIGYNQNTSERTFSHDGYDQRAWYARLVVKHKKLDLSKPLTKKEKSIKTAYEEIEIALQQAAIRIEEKRKEEYIESINVLKRHPRRHTLERSFSDNGSNQGFWYAELQKAYNDIDFSNELTEDEKRTKAMYEEIEKAYQEALLYVEQEKKNEYIESLRLLKRHPKAAGYKQEFPEMVFSRDGNSQRSWYNILKRRYLDLDLSKPLTAQEESIKTVYEEIEQEYLKIVDASTDANTNGNSSPRVLQKKKDN